MSNSDDKTVSTEPAYTVRVILQTCKEYLTPRYYEKFLFHAGLERYHTDLPPLEATPAATYDEIATFMADIYSVTRDGVYPLFCQNLGLALAKNFFNTPILPKIKEKITPSLQDPSLSLAEKMQIIVEKVNKYIPPAQDASYHVEGLSYVSIAPRCVYCSAIKTDKLICLVRKAVVGEILQWLTGWSFIVEQYQSVARGDLACSHRFTVYHQKLLTN